MITATVFTLHTSHKDLVRLIDCVLWAFIDSFFMDLSLIVDYNFLLCNQNFVFACKHSN